MIHFFWSGFVTDGAEPVSPGHFNPPFWLIIIKGVWYVKAEQYGLPGETKMLVNLAANTPDQLNGKNIHVRKKRP